jgi:hypothetical protein
MKYHDYTSHFTASKPPLRGRSRCSLAMFPGVNATGSGNTREWREWDTWLTGSGNAFTQVAECTTATTPLSPTKPRGWHERSQEP